MMWRTARITDFISLESSQSCFTTLAGRALVKGATQWRVGSCSRSCTSSSAFTMTSIMCACLSSPNRLRQQGGSSLPKLPAAFPDVSID